MSTRYMTNPGRTVFCPACGAEVSRNAATCPRCGEPIRGNPAVHRHGTLIAHIIVGVLMGALVLYWGLAFLRALLADADRQLQGFGAGEIEMINYTDGGLYAGGGQQGHKTGADPSIPAADLGRCGRG